MRKFIYLVSLFIFAVLTACDLQPKIASIPDSVGSFIENRYPALLADPETQPEIYNSAASDYGVYESPDMYGSYNVNDYVLYASLDDYTFIPEKQESKQVEKNEEKIPVENDDYIIVPSYGGDFSKDLPIKEDNIVQESKDYVVIEKGDTLYSIARKNNMKIAEIAKINDFKEPYNLSIGQKVLLREPKVAKETKIPNVISQEKVEQIKTETKPSVHKKLQEITVAKGDTLYSLSRKYEIPVNDLAVMNKISAPFALSVGQKLKVPKHEKELLQETVADKKITPVKVSAERKTEVIVNKTEPVQTKQKISSEPKKPLPKITPRSATKFSWPVKGKILSQYGAKTGGLFNDGINISAAHGSVVKAAENGVVAYAGNEVKGMGNLIIIQHSDGWMSVYAHLDSMNVRRGTKVSVGQQIGKIGQTGKVDKPQLHFEIRRGTKAYDPIQYLKK